VNLAVSGIATIAATAIATQLVRMAIDLSWFTNGQTRKPKNINISRTRHSVTITQAVIRVRVSFVVMIAPL